MRVRVVTNPPLPVLKAWFSLQSIPATATVSDFKDQLCSGIRVLHGLKKIDITLLLDDFQLLDEGPINVIRDGDLIYIEKVTSSGQSSLAAEATPISKKRKRDDGVSDRKIAPLQSRQAEDEVLSSSEPDSDSDSTSDDTSSESSSSASESDDDSDTGSSARSSSGLKQAVTKSKTVTFMPPGQGKQTTRSRNIRRRRKKQYDRLAAQEIPVNEAAGVNAIPLNRRVAGDTSLSTHVTPDLKDSTAPLTTNGTSELTMTSLANKNKKRGFKNAIGKNVPVKIVFSQETIESPSSVDKDVVPLQAVLKRLISPSEKQEAGQLPDNMFVTSVDVEYSKWKRKRTETQDYMEKEAAVVQNKQSHEGEGLDFDTIEQHWDALVQIKEHMDIPVGTLVGWKALGINPTTRTPEVLVHAARVLKLEESGVLVRLRGGPSGSEGTDGDEEIVYSWDDVIAGQWKIISIENPVM